MPVTPEAPQICRARAELHRADAERIRRSIDALLTRAETAEHEASRLERVARLMDEGTIPTGRN